MAQCKQSPHEFIRNAFTPQIAVMCTPLAEKCCQKNNLDFIELLQPFSRLNSDVHYKDTSGPVNIRNFKLNFLDVTWRPPQTSVARKLLNSSVSNAPESRIKSVQVGNFKLEIPSSTPWFETWRETFLRVQYPSDHEFTKHFLACLLVVSSADNSTTDAFHQLVQSLNKVQSSAPGKLPKWFSSNILKYYVIVHDNVEGNLAVANSSFESVKSTYGASNCFLLKMNSRASRPIPSEHLPDPWSQFITNQLDMKESIQDNTVSSKNSSLEIGQEAEETKNIQNYHPLSPVNEDSASGDSMVEEDKPAVLPKSVPHGSYLSTEDVEQVKLLILEFTRSCLLPYIEKQLVILNDVVSNKKGMSKSLFSATKRWFSPNKPGAGSVAVNNLIYSPDSPELQIRRLGDLYFMFGHYDAAFQAYHLAKRDYNTDQAWLYYAGALEMAALSAFMNREPTKKTCDYMEEGITTYLNTCKMPQFATRATILSSECLKHQKMYGEAALQLIRMTSEESDLRSALLLEQAAYCFLQSKMIRKYAFHMVLAGHRFSKAAQRKHSLKCYKQAYQVYENTGWDLACDHIHYTIGRQANNLQQFEEAVESFSRLLNGGSKQSAQQQAMFLKEYLTILGNKLKAEGQQYTSPILPVPKLNMNLLKLLVGPTPPLSTPGKVPAIGIGFNTPCDINVESKWYKLEEILLHEVEGSTPMVFKPMVTLYTNVQLIKNKPTAIVNEPIQVSFELVNTLQTVLHLKDIYLLWTFKNDEQLIVSEILDDRKDNFVKTYVMKSVTIEGNSKHDIILSLMPLLTGSLTINGFCYTLTGSTASETSFIKAKQLIFIPSNTSRLRGNDDTGSGNEMDINILPPAPCLQVTFSEISLDFLVDEMQRISVDFQNTSSVPLQNIYLATSVPHLVSFVEFRQKVKTPLDLSDITTPATREKLARKNHITSVPLSGNVLEPGQTTTVYIWIKAPKYKGATPIDLLVYYENVDKKSIPKYRLVRHCWNLTVHESLSIEVTSQAGHKAKEVEELDLVLKIINLNKVHSSVLTEITLLNIGLLSKYWTVSKDIAMPKYINLHSQESAHILLKARRGVKGSSEYSSMSLNSDKKSYKTLQNIFIAFGRKAEGPQLNIFNETEDFNYKENKDGILMLQWRALVIDTNSRRVVHGQCVIPMEVNRTEEDVLQLDRILSDSVIDINEKNSLEEERSQVAQNQVSYNLVYPPVVTHNFQKGRVCVIPVKLLLHSVIDTVDLKVVVNTCETSDMDCTINRSTLYYRNASSNFRWMCTGKIVRTIKPLTTETVMLSACVTGPGTYNLGAHIQVSCSKVEKAEPYVVQTCPIHAALIVHSIS
ncbi:hypothetical protein NQ315_010230 [Exocentrus adspersus]|uniref:Trafficking protein particle complex subunit 8 n=1 Tax=Exocentrus adspersus TaxID=1586481 RepID=A0AAV8WAK6_9CUCU|nr:hypothetical protein NQ315_010230 [Exocentrus adspersus]